MACHADGRRERAQAGRQGRLGAAHQDRQRRAVCGGHQGQGRDAAQGRQRRARRCRRSRRPSTTWSPARSSAPGPTPEGRCLRSPFFVSDPAMALYAIGDLQGCLDPLAAAPRQARLRSGARPPLVRGRPREPRPRLARVPALREGPGRRRAVTVLGNHDLHLLCVAEGRRASARRATRWTRCSRAPDRDELLDWLRRRPAHARRRRIRDGARGAAAAVDGRAGARAGARGRSRAAGSRAGGASSRTLRQRTRALARRPGAATTGCARS